MIWTRETLALEVLEELISCSPLTRNGPQKTDLSEPTKRIQI